MTPAAWIVALFALAQSPSWPLSEARLAMTSLGPVRIGMGEALVRKTTQAEFSGEPGGAEGCAQAHVFRDPGIVFMFEKRVLTRIDLADAHHTTLRGLRIGDSEQRARDLYAREFEDSPHKYVKGGRNLTIRSADKRYALVIETDGRFVTHLRAGAIPSAEYVEGCS
jgi:hypothetical protein